MAAGDVTEHHRLPIDLKFLAAIPMRRLRWKSAYRLVPSRYPTIDIFERVADPDDWQLLYELEALTNPRLREEAGEISLVPPSRRVTGPGASIVMAPFTHASPDRPTRFSSGSYGVYYAANRLETALREVAFHMGAFYGATKDSPHDEAYRTYKGAVDSILHDLRSGDFARFLNPRRPGRASCAASSCGRSRSWERSWPASASSSSSPRTGTRCPAPRGSPRCSR